MIGRVVGFLTECKAELKKVAWPSKDELKNSVMVVIVSFVLFSVLVSLIDFILNTALGWLI